MDSGPLQYSSQYVTLAEQAAQSEIVTSINVNRSYNTGFPAPSINSERELDFETSDWINSDGGGIAKCRMWWG